MTVLLGLMFKPWEQQRSQGGGGARAPPHWPFKYAKSHVFGAFEAGFWWKNENSPPKGIWVPKLWSSCRDLASKTVWTSEFGRKIRLNFGEDLFFFSEITCFWAEKGFEFPILAEKSDSISVKTFFFWRSPVFGLKKGSNFRFWPKNPCDSDTRTMKIRVKVACSCLTLSKKPPPFFSNPGYAPAREASNLSPQILLLMSDIL